MTPEELRQILTRNEGPKLDFKFRCYRFDAPDKVKRDETWDEFRKDILALANGNVGTASETAYLIIGAHDSKRLPDGTRLIEDVGTAISDTEKFRQQAISRVNNICSPPLPDLQCESVLVDGKRLIVIIIPPSPFVHETTKGVAGHVARTVFIRRGEGIAPASPMERERLEGEKETLATPTVLLEDYLVQEAELERFQSSFVPPDEDLVTQAQQTLSDHRLLIIKGPMGIGKRSLALYLASTIVPDQASKIIRTRRFTLVSELMRVTDSVILMPDFFGLFRFERTEVEDEIPTIDRLCSNNFVILTTSDAVLEEAMAETRLEDWDLLRECQVTLDEGAYGEAIWQEIWNVYLQQALERGRISSSHQDWVSDALADRAKASLVWPAKLKVPLTIKRFVDGRLPQATTKANAIRAVKETVSLEAELRDWFFGLGRSEQSFALMLGIFNGFERSRFWQLYMEAIHTLRSLDPNLTAEPLTILVERTQPYVSANGTVQLSHPSYQQAILTVIAQSYREYFLELLPVFERITIPSEDTLHGLDESYDLRVAVAVALGEVGKERLDDIIPLLEEWAVHTDARVRGAVGIALSQVVQNRTRVRPTLKLLHDWARDFSVGYFKRWAAAAALWRIGQIDLDLVLPELKRLADDSHERVRAAVAYGAIRLGRKNAEEMAPIVQSLGGDEDQYVRLQAADAARAMWRRDRATVTDILDKWASSENLNELWTTTWVVVSMPQLSQETRLNLLGHTLSCKPEIFSSVALLAAREGRCDLSDTFQLCERLFQSDPDAAADPLADILVACAESNPESTWAVVRRWAEHGDSRFRVVAASFLGRTWPTYGESIAGLLQELANDEEREVQSAVKRAQAEMARLHMPVLRSRLSEATGRRRQIVGRLRELEAGLKESVHFGDVVLSMLGALAAAWFSCVPFVCLSQFIGSIVESRDLQFSIFLLSLLFPMGIGVFVLVGMLARARRKKKRLVATRRERYELEMASLREQMAEVDTEIVTTKAQIATLEKCSK